MGIVVVAALAANAAGDDSAAMTATRQGLKENGHVEGENVAIEYLWADNQPSRLPALAAELVQRRARSSRRCQ